MVEPGRDVNVAHPDYVAPAAANCESHSHIESDDGLSLTARRYKLHGDAGLSAHEIAQARAELGE